MTSYRPRKSQAEIESNYKDSGVWKCAKSPSGAHFLEFREKTAEKAGFFECKHCGYVRKIEEQTSNPPQWSNAQTRGRGKKAEITPAPKASK